MVTDPNDATWLSICSRSGFMKFCHPSTVLISRPVWKSSTLKECDLLSDKLFIVELYGIIRPKKSYNLWFKLIGEMNRVFLYEPISTQHIKCYKLSCPVICGYSKKMHSTQVFDWSCICQKLFFSDISSGEPCQIASTVQTLKRFNAQITSSFLIYQNGCWSLFHWVRMGLLRFNNKKMRIV